ncbi:MAG: 2-C-methyl-D-erythritol 2,4-cyclodiphosphate synthase [Chloroflexota bacterium]|nr:2-C-methyl-D-erythritol 2,4-cyclodiphosphate synthase [Chloroflexota bacterium]
MRVGIGEDLHRVAEGGPLMLGGVAIEGTVGLAGHSDADVLLHAITDAVLGAAGKGDLGAHFPSSDDRWAGADSSLFLTEALRMAREDGWVLANLDATVRAERPRLAGHLAAIRESVARIAGVDPSKVNVKAKSGEGLDAVGRGEAIGATAVALLEAAP